ncbi:MAG: hypothetical protein V7722_07405 [Porticoccus sp.]
MKDNLQLSTKLTLKTISGSLLDKYEGENLIKDVGYVIENLDAKSALSAAAKLSNARGLGVFCMGGILTIIREQRCYEELGYESFKQFVEKDLGLARSTANDWIAIYINLVNSEVPWDEISHLGWTKIRLFARYLTKENWKQWIEIAEQNNAMQLRGYVREHVKSAAAIEADKGNPFIDSEVPTQVATDDLAVVSNSSKVEASAASISTDAPLVTPEVASSVKKKYIFHVPVDDQGTVDDALQQVMIESGTEYPSVALVYLCMNFSSSYDPRSD